MIATLSQQDIEYTDAKSLKNTIKVSGNAFSKISMECCAVAHVAVRAADGTEQQSVVSVGISLYKIASPLKCLFLSDLFADQNFLARASKFVGGLKGDDNGEVCLY